MLQTEPQIQEVLGLEEAGHDYYLQITDARPDTGGLSGATPGEAVSWGKVDPEKLPDAVVCYADTTIALPLLTAYVLDRHEPREPRRLFDRREEMYDRLVAAYREKAGGEPPGEFWKPEIAWPTLWNVRPGPDSAAVQACASRTLPAAGTIHAVIRWSSAEPDNAIARRDPGPDHYPDDRLRAAPIRPGSRR